MVERNLDSARRLARKAAVQEVVRGCELSFGMSGRVEESAASLPGSVPWNEKPELRTETKTRRGLTRAFLRHAEAQPNLPWTSEQKIHRLNQGQDAREGSRLLSRIKKRRSGSRRSV